MAAYPNFYNQFQQPVQQQPLPPGWEAKYDPNHRRYYFLNHATRQTTWVDPRSATPQQQPVQTGYQQASQAVGQQASQQRSQQASQQGSQQTAQQAQQPSTSGQRNRAQQEESIGLQNLSSRDSQDQHAETTFSEEAQGGKTAKEKREVKNKITKGLDVPDSILDTVLSAADYNEDRARAILKHMGYGASGKKPAAAKAGKKAASKPSSSADESRPAQKYEEMKTTDFSALYKAPTEQSQSPQVSAPVGETASTSRETPTDIPTSVSRSDIQLSVDTKYEDFLSSGNESRMVFDSSESQIISSTKSEALQALLSGKTDSSRSVPQDGFSASSLMSNVYSPGIAAGTLAKGRNNKLASGPNPKLRNSKKVVSFGANPSLHSGHNKALLSNERTKRIIHHSLAAGRNPRLCNGPDGLLSHGPRQSVPVALL